ncbi:hypothetical protein [Chryseobacterium sp. M5A1_1a]
MKKNLVYGLLLLSTLSVSLNSCRTDEMLTGTEQMQKEKIAFFERFEKEKSFSKNTESNNYALPFGNSMLAYFENYPDKKTELENRYGIVDLKVSSQDMDLDGGKKLLMFPMLTDGKVTAVIGGVINAERDFLYFDVYKEGHPDRDYLIQTFQQYYNSLSLGRTIDVGEVVIIVKKPQLTKPDPWDDLGGDGGHDMGGGNGDYGSGNGGGGSSGTPNTPNNTDPCAQMQAQKSNPDYNKNVKDLEGKTKEKQERGYAQGNGVFTYLDKATTKDDANSLTLPNPEQSGNKDITGFMHTHIDSYNFQNDNGDDFERLGIKMFSPADVSYFMDLLQSSNKQGKPLGDVYGMMITSNGSYQIRFAGTSSQIKLFSDDQLKALKISYSAAMNGTKDLETAFLKFLSEKMDIEGVTLHKTPTIGKPSVIKLSPDKKTKSSTDC